MASLTKQTENVRKRKERTRGKVRKRKIRANGTTPTFPIHVPEHNEGKSDS